MSYTNQSAEIVAASVSSGTKLKAKDTEGRMLTHDFVYTSASNVATNTVQITEAMPTGAEVRGYFVQTSGTAAGAGVTLDIGLSGGTATSIAADLDIAANGIDEAPIAPVDASGQVAYLTYNDANPADGNVITGYIIYTVS